MWSNYVLCKIWQSLDSNSHYLGFNCVCVCVYLFVVSVSADDLVDNCSAIQQRSFSSLTPDTVLDHIGIFGNSDPLVLSQWLEVINETVKAETQVCLCVCCVYMWVYCISSNRLARHSISRSETVHTIN